MYLFFGKLWSNNTMGIHHTLNGMYRCMVSSWDLEPFRSILQLPIRLYSSSFWAMGMISLLALFSANTINQCTQKYSTKHSWYRSHRLLVSIPPSNLPPDTPSSWSMLGNIHSIIHRLWMPSYSSLHSRANLGCHSPTSPVSYWSFFPTRHTDMPSPCARSWHVERERHKTHIYLDHKTSSNMNDSLDFGVLGFHRFSANYDH